MISCCPSSSALPTYYIFTLDPLECTTKLLPAECQSFIRRGGWWGEKIRRAKRTIPAYEPTSSASQTRHWLVGGGRWSVALTKTMAHCIEEKHNRHHTACRYNYQCNNDSINTRWVTIADKVTVVQESSDKLWKSATGFASIFRFFFAIR